MIIFGINRQIITAAFLVYNLGINVISPENMHTQMFYELSLFIIIGLACIYMVKFIRDNK